MTLEILRNAKSTSLVSRKNIEVRVVCAVICWYTASLFGVRLLHPQWDHNSTGPFIYDLSKHIALLILTICTILRGDPRGRFFYGSYLRIVALHLDTTASSTRSETDTTNGDEAVNARNCDRLRSALALVWPTELVNGEKGYAIVRMIL